MSCIGIRAEGCRLMSRPNELIHHLDMLYEIGYRAIEIVPESFDLIVCGERVKEHVDRLREILYRYPFSCTLHAPGKLNLWNVEYGSLHEKVFETSLALCRELGATVLTCHTGSPSDNAGLPLRDRPGVDEVFSKERIKRECDIIRRGSEKYEEVTIALENQRPYAGFSPWTYGERLTDLAQQVRTINRSNVGITLDTGHLNLSAFFYKEDPLKEISLIEDLIVHTHLHDNHGMPNFPGDRDKSNHLPFGLGDAHRIPGRGNFPFAAFFQFLKGYKGIWMVELTDRYMCKDDIVESFAAVSTYCKPDKGKNDD